MQIEKLLSRSIQTMPPSTRQKALRSKAKVDISQLIHMGWNENPYGMSPKAKAAMQDAMQVAHYYPDFNATALKQAIADFYQVSLQQVLTGSGSSAMIDMLGMTFLNEGEEVLFCSPTFGAFADMSYLSGAKPVSVPMAEGQVYNLPGLLAAITDKTKMIVICNPNNPTGTYVSDQAIAAFLAAVPENILVVFDEAYIEFATAADCHSMVKLVRAGCKQPVIVLRTFSKYYGMAGARVGYALGDEQLISYMNKCAAAWNLNVMAQKAGIAALADQDYYQGAKAKVVASREYLTRELQALGCTVYPSQSNFIYFDAGMEPAELQFQLMQRGIRIGAFAYSRVSIGTQPECELFIRYVKEILGKC